MDMKEKGCLLLAIGVLEVSASGCGILGPSCTGGRTGPVTTISGEVASGQVVSHQVPYSTEGTQNNVSVGWTWQFSPGGPQILVFATRVECVDFTPPADLMADTAPGACAILGQFAGVSPIARPCFVDRTCAPSGGDLISHGLITNQGNRLGSNPQYKLWVVGDRGQAVTYSISITWVFAVDC